MLFKSLTSAAIPCRGDRRPPAPATYPAPGATFPFPLYAKWAEAYKKDTGNGLNYQAIGSGGGIKAI